MSMTERLKAIEEKIETMDMLIQSLQSELKKALEEIETLTDGFDRETLRRGLSDL
jgi:uncharacterized protein (UPF0335 family)